MKSALLLTVLAVADSSCDFPQFEHELKDAAVEELFSRWEACHPNRLGLAKGHEKMLETFSDTVKFIFERNAREVSRGTSLRLALNEFSALTAEEFAALKRKVIAA